MMNKIINFHDDLFARFSQIAAAHGKTPEDVIIAMVEDFVEEEDAEYDPTTDPLAPFIGSMHFAQPDLASNHHAYLAEAYGDTHEQEP